MLLLCHSCSTQQYFFFCLFFSLHSIYNKLEITLRIHELDSLLSRFHKRTINKLDNFSFNHLTYLVEIRNISFKIDIQLILKYYNQQLSFVSEYIACK